MDKTKVVIGSDHAGFQAKEEIKKILVNLGFTQIIDVGPNSGNSVDYPIYAKKVAKEVLQKDIFGILICGSGTGMQIAANKIKGIRAAFSYDKYSATMARQDNNANIITLRAREFDHSKYKEILQAFFQTEFSEEQRHKKRIDLLE